MVPPRWDARGFTAFPAQLARQLRPYVLWAVNDVFTNPGGLEDAVPGGADEPVAGPLRDGIVQAMRYFCDLIEDPGAATWEKLNGCFLEIGGWLALEGRGLDEVHRLLFGTVRAVWRTLNDQVEIRFDRDTLNALADAQFDFLDAVSAALAKGYQAQGPQSAIERHHLRRKLADLLLSDPAADPATLAELSRQINWPLPRTIAAVALAPREGHRPRHLILPDELLMRPDGSRPWLLLPDPDGPGRSQLLEPLLTDWVVAVGPTVPLAQLNQSLGSARDTLALARHGMVADTGLLRSDEHFSLLVLFRSKTIIDQAAAGRLAPLESVTPEQRDRLAETLLALLEHNFNATAASADLHVHPQTVRYRLRHLQELFGDTLQDPQLRLEMQMILHARLAWNRSKRHEAAPAVTMATGRRTATGNRPQAVPPRRLPVRSVPEQPHHEFTEQRSAV